MNNSFPRVGGTHTTLVVFLGGLVLAAFVVGFGMLVYREARVRDAFERWKESRASESAPAAPGATSAPGNSALEELGRRIEQWERDQQQAVESAQSARVAYAILRSRGEANTSAECLSQVFRADTADRRAAQLSRRITQACRSLASPDREPHRSAGDLDDVTTDSASHRAEGGIPEPVWHGGNDAFMLYRP